KVGQASRTLSHQQSCQATCAQTLLLRNIETRIEKVETSATNLEYAAGFVPGVPLIRRQMVDAGKREFVVCVAIRERAGDRTRVQVDRRLIERSGECRITDHNGRLMVVDLALHRQVP